MKNKVTEIFSELYVGEKMHDFYFYSLIQSIFDYIIIIPRKCLTEFKCLRTQYKDMSLCENKHYMTSKSYIRYKEQMLKEIREGKDIYILIIDDIMLYGRGIKLLLKEMLGDLAEPLRKTFLSKIHVTVFIENANEYENDSNSEDDSNSDDEKCDDDKWVIDAFNEILENRYSRYFSFKNVRDINRASDLFLESFYATATSNTSFVNTWYCKTDSLVIYEMEGGKIIKIHIRDLYKQNSTLQYSAIDSNEDQKRHGFFSCIYYEKPDNQNDKWIEFQCMRAYHNYDINKTFFVPYVFLKPMSKDQIDSVLDSLKDLLDFVRPWDELGDSDQAYILKYEYLTNLLSDCYGAYFYNRYLKNEHKSWDDLFEEEMISAEFSFGPNAVVPMGELCEKQTDMLWKEITDSCNRIVGQKNVFFKQEQNAFNLFKQVMDECGQCNEIVWTVLEKANMMDTALAKEGKGKFFGMTTLSMRRMLEERGDLSMDDPAVLYSELIRCMDQGSASLKIEKLETVNKDRYYGGVINSGEQAYRLFQEPVALGLRYFAKIEEDCINLLIPNETEQKIDEFLESYKSLRLSGMISADELELIRQGVHRRKAKYSDYDVIRKNQNLDQGVKEKFDQAYESIIY